MLKVQAVLKSLPLTAFRELFCMQMVVYCTLETLSLPFRSSFCCHAPSLPLYSQHKEDNRHGLLSQKAFCLA